MRNRIPAETVTLLSGDGATGKTLIAFQLASAIVRGAQDWLGGTIESSGPVIFFSAEEDYDELHRRLAAIIGSEFENLGGLHILAMPDQDALLALATKDGKVRATLLFERLEAAACQIKPVLIVVEAAADVFGGDENNRSQVRQFIGLMRHLAIKSGAAVLLLAHPSLSGLASGSGMSGRLRQFFLRVFHSVSSNHVTSNFTEQPVDDRLFLLARSAQITA